ncbi:porin family protein [Pontibacter mangrovi]|uniref:Porin family protein n=1 Tax=Pontibacter mangrovi TaxID=2589816 RepID=A0A501W1J5_9BACT|nr:outer membrane beta-barrel protein [Pontibacter mangrovi]TPE43489.1 porin family protein [Pontibacter mangrovi]
MKQLYLTLTFLFICTCTFAQKSFRPGFVIQNGDTIRGYVDYRGAMRSATVTTFKPNENAAEQSYTPQDIEAYGFLAEQKLYEVLEVPVAPDSLQQVRVFLEALVKGPASLYYFRDAEQRNRFFLKKEQEPLTELTYDVLEHRDKQTGKKYNVWVKSYAQAMTLAFADCPKINTHRLEKLRFTTEALAGITRDYNQCVAPQSKQLEGQIKRPVFTFGPAATYTFSTFKLKGQRHAIAQADYKDEGPGFGGGLTANITVPKLNEKLSLQVDLLYMPFKQVASFTYGNTDGMVYGYEYDYDVRFEADFLKLPIQLKYTYPNGKLRPYFSAGLANNFVLQATQEAIITDNYYADKPRVNRQEPFGEDGFRKRTFGLTAGAGLQLPVGENSMSLEVRYETNETSSAIKSLSAQAKHVYFMLSYRL